MLFVAMGGIDGPIYLAVSNSLRLRLSVLVVHFGAAVLLLSVLPSTALLSVAVLAIAVNAWRVRYQLSHAFPDDIVGLLLSSTDAWRLSLRDGRALGAELLDAPLISPALTVLSFKLENGQRRQLALLTDNVPAADYRRLRVRLRFPRRQT